MDDGVLVGEIGPHPGVVEVGVGVGFGFGGFFVWVGECFGDVGLLGEVEVAPGLVGVEDDVELAEDVDDGVVRALEVIDGVG